jgi:hypothetical protein
LLSVLFAINRWRQSSTKQYATDAAQYTKEHDERSPFHCFFFVYQTCPDCLSKIAKNRSIHGIERPTALLATPDGTGRGAPKAPFFVFGGTILQLPHVYQWA